MPLHAIDLDPVSVTLDDIVGHLAALTIRDGARRLSPLHRAPWADDPTADFPAGTAPNVQHLSGDFFCAPFGRNDLEAAPSHGWPANSAWDHVETSHGEGRSSMLFRLRQRVMGATLDKRLTLVAGHPFLYQEHVFSDGDGAVSASHHTMVHMRAGGDLAFSPKQAALTPPEALESDPARGRSILAYPARSADLGAFPLAGGGSVDLRRFPPGESHEDFLTLVEAPAELAGKTARAIGWTAVSRVAEQDHVLVLKRTDVLPVTMLWISNGGRDYAPWSSRHTGVLGIEDARASGLGHADSCRDNDLTRIGVPTAFALAAGRTTVIRQVIGAVAAEPGEGRVVGLEPSADGLTLRFAGGAARSVGYDGGFLGE
ncbi:hypothetical protein [Hoeflea olei]|uniref:DUF4432 domain-containing protein n=1 Tax=Hoeflea olei TaxID=1480615 RepID=A0A1C1YPM9_9HYPH|nr:hypothetical protein [Hoeflea olei]OCW55521.1 hypothetical protein AWJ14_05880 [Hoeflea olei]